MCTVADAPDAMSPNAQLSVWFGAEPAIEQAADAGLIAQLMPAPPGSGSLKVTDFAVPGPALETPIVKPMEDPALTVDESTVLVIARFGQFTTVDADACTLCALVAAAVAVFGYAAQLACDVLLVTCTEADAPDATLPNEQPSIWFGAEPVTEQAALAGLIDQLTPAPPGSGSTSVTPVAVPAPVFATVIVNPIGSPALTDVASAVFVI